MIEKLKTLALTVLIMGSLLQSYLLAYSSPNYEPIPQNDYVQAEPLGSQTELNDLLFPDQIIVHMGNGQHSVLYPNSFNYKTLLENVTQRRFEGFRKTTTYLVNVNWEDVRNKQQGVEIRFRDGIPINVLQNLVQIKGEIPFENDVITRIWIFAKEKEEIRTFLFTDTPGVGYEVIQADFTSKDVENFVAYGDSSIPYKSVNGENYLPIKPVRVSGYTISFTEFTADHLKRSLFVDPGITRNLKERDGSEIYTDAKRGLQINKEQRWMNYSDPVAPLFDSKTDTKGNLIAGVQFVNQHEGWDGNYAVVARTPLRQSSSNQPFIFRLYYDSFPLVNSRLDGFGTIKLLVQKGVVSGYERSMIIPDNKAVRKNEGILPSADDIEERLKNYPRRGSILSIFPAYRPHITEKAVVLTPTWALELRDGTYDYMD